MEARKRELESVVERAEAHLTKIGCVPVLRDVVCDGRRFDIVAIDPEDPTVVFVDIFDGDPALIDVPLTYSERKSYEAGAGAFIADMEAMRAVPSFDYRLDRVHVPNLEPDPRGVIHAVDVSRKCLDDAGGRVRQERANLVWHADSVVAAAAERVSRKGAEVLDTGWISDSGRDIDLVYIQDGIVVFAWVLLTFDAKCVWGEDLLYEVPSPSWIPAAREYLSEHPEIDDGRWRVDAFSFCMTDMGEAVVRHHAGAWSSPALEGGEAA